jgi:cobalamin-dependent methionine synthase I
MRQEAMGSSLTQRFSAGYGDLPLELQRDIFGALDCQRKIGVTLNESLLMSPSKSVSAIVGIINT